MFTAAVFVLCAASCVSAADEGELMVVVVGGSRCGFGVACFRLNWMPGGQRGSFREG